MKEFAVPCQAFIASWSDHTEGAYMFEGLFQPMHLLVILGIALLVFGPKKLPELGKGLGEGIRIFKSSLRDGNDDSSAADHKSSSTVIDSTEVSDSKLR